MGGGGGSRALVLAGNTDEGDVVADDFLLPFPLHLDLPRQSDPGPDHRRQRYFRPRPARSKSSATTSPSSVLPASTRALLPPPPTSTSRPRASSVPPVSPSPTRWATSTRGLRSAASGRRSLPASTTARPVSTRVLASPSPRSRRTPADSPLMSTHAHSSVVPSVVSSSPSRGTS